MTTVFDLTVVSLYKRGRESANWPRLSSPLLSSLSFRANESHFGGVGGLQSPPGLAGSLRRNNIHL